MKKLAVFIALVGLLIVPALAHPGGTDYKGGHTDHSTGEYHYHHGYSAHDHVDGVCPYDFDDKTGEDSGSWGGGVAYASTTSYKSSDWYPEYTAAKAALRKAEATRFRDAALSGVGGLALGLALLIVQHVRSNRRLEESERRMREQAENSRDIEVRKLNSEWQKKLAQEEQSKALLIADHEQLSNQRRELQMICLEEAKETIGRMAKPVSDYEFQLGLEYLNTNLEEAFEYPVEPDTTDGVVYVQQDLQGGKYHFDDCCNGKKMILVGMKSAARLGFVACSNCTHGMQPTVEHDVIVSQQRYSLYHEIGSCLKGDGVIISLDDAKRRNLKPCPRCKPPSELPRVWF